MKSRYTSTLADMEMNVLTEESESSVNELVTTIDRRIREINTRSRHCSKTEAALLCALDYCADKFRAQRRVKTLEAELTFAAANIERLKADLEKANARLRACGQRTVESSVPEDKP